MLPGESFRATAVRLLRLAKRFAAEDGAEEDGTRSLCQGLTQGGSKEKEPEDLFDTADLTSKYFKFAIGREWTH